MTDQYLETLVERQYHGALHSAMVAEQTELTGSEIPFDEIARRRARARKLRLALACLRGESLRPWAPALIQYSPKDGEYWLFASPDHGDGAIKVALPYLAGAILDWVQE